jgi:hypothetical protein
MKMEPEREEVSIDDIVISNMYSIEAIVRLLIEKKILTEEEILRKIQEVKSEHPNNSGLI